MSNRVYDVLKFIAQIILPAVGTLYAALAGIWGFPYGEPIVATIMAVDTFLGAILGISKYRYDKEQDGWLSDYIVKASEGWKVTGRSEK